MGEEAKLLAIPREQRKAEHRARLRAVSDKLDRIWERLGERAERLSAGDVGGAEYVPPKSHS